LSIAIAHTHTEHASNPSMTAFTIQWACKNNAISDTSVDASGKADCATSAGFISDILSTQASHILREQMAAGPTAARQTRRYAPTLTPVVSHGRPAEAWACISRQHVKTRAISASLRP
jgi:hypothetical protein